MTPPGANSKTQFAAAQACGYLGVMHWRGEGKQPFVLHCLSVPRKEIAEYSHELIEVIPSFSFLLFLIGLQQDNYTARRWFEMGASGGDPQSLNALGLMWKDGIGGYSKDLKKAFQHFSKAAEKQHPDALANLGELFYRKFPPFISLFFEKKIDLDRQIPQLSIFLRHTTLYPRTITTPLLFLKP